MMRAGRSDDAANRAEVTAPGLRYMNRQRKKRIHIQLLQAESP
jgi:hypothetical protein